MRAHGLIKYSMFVLLIVSLITARNNVASTQPTGTLRFKSGFESPVEFTDSTRRHFMGADQGCDWSDYDHFINYVEGRVGVDVDSQLSTIHAHSGSRSLYQAKLRRGGQWRSQLVFPTYDDYFGTRIFVRKWLYYPTDFDLPEHGWMAGVFSHRETGNLNTGDQFTVGMGIWRHSSYSDELFWVVEGLKYKGSGSPEYRTFRAFNLEVAVPRGRWFKLEEYVERHPTEGVVKVWVDDQLIFELSGVQTKYNTGNVKVAHMVGKVMVGNEDYGYTYPYYHWLDDLEIWDGMPSQSGASTYLDDGFEDGTFNAWRANISNSGSSIDIANDQTYDSSNYSAKVTGVDAVNDYALLYKTLARRREYYLRAYFMIDTLPGNGTEANIAIRLKDQTNGWYLGELYLRNYNMTLQAGLYYYHNGVQIIQWTNKTYSTNTWYCVEVHVECGNGDGEVQLWWNEELLFNQTSLNNNGNVERAYVGVGMWRGDSFSLGAAWFDSVKLDSAYIGAESNAPVHAHAPVRFASTCFSAEGIGEGPLPNVKINGTRLTDASGYCEWAGLAYNKVHTFVVEKPAGHYPAWVLNVEGSYTWNGTHYILRHNVTETQSGPIEIYFSPTEEVYIKSSTHKLTWAYLNSSSQNPHTSMRFKIAADIGVTSRLEIYAADEGHPRPYKIEGATDWRYDSINEILTVWMLHTIGGEAEIEWRGAAMGQ